MSKYVNLSRVLLTVDYLKAGDLPRYEKGLHHTSTTYSSNSGNYCIVEGDEIIVPLFLVSAKGDRKGNNIKKVNICYDSILKREDISLFDMIDHAISKAYNVNCIYDLNMFENRLLDVFYSSSCNGNISNICINENNSNLFKGLKSVLWVPSNEFEYRYTNCLGKFNGASVYTTKSVKYNNLYFLPSSNDLGVLVVKNDIDFAYENNDLIFGEEIGMFLRDINFYKLTLTEDSNKVNGSDSVVDIFEKFTSNYDKDEQTINNFWEFIKEEFGNK